MVNWKRNLAVLGIGQFLSISGFLFAIPFAPYYMQELGVTNELELNFWVALFGAATPLTLCIFAPLWGAAADRYGRKPMLLRAYLAAAIVLILMGTVRSVEALVVLRLLQGAFTGTVTASQTLVSAHTPKHRSGFALGVLSSGVFGGLMIGGFVGGMCADLFGYRMAFMVGGGVLVLACLVVGLGAKEEFTRPPKEQQRSVQRKPLLSTLRENKGVLSVMIMMGAMALGRLFDNSFVPLLVQEINGSMDGIAWVTGALYGLSGLAGLLAGVLLGRLADRYPPTRVAQVCALCAGAMMIPEGLARGFELLFGARYCMTFFAGGLDPIFLAWLSANTSAEKRGIVFGWATSARAMGWIMAPLLSGTIASLYGVRAIYFVGCALFVCLSCGMCLLPRETRKEHEH